MFFALKTRLVTLSQVFNYTKNPLLCLSTYISRKKAKISFKWGFIEELTWLQIRAIVKLADSGWYALYCSREGHILFTDGVLKFIAPSINKIGVLGEGHKLYRRFNYNGTIVLDIGAFTGDSLILFFKWGAKKVIAYEPIPENVESIKQNVKTNKLERKVIINSYAVSDKNGYLTFTYDDLGIDFGLKEGKHEITLPCVSIKEVLKASEKIDIAKVDCEGCEKHLLKIDELIIPNWVIEVHDISTLRALIKHFKEKKYHTQVEQVELLKDVFMLYAKRCFKPPRSELKR